MLVFAPLLLFWVQCVCKKRLAKQNGTYTHLQGPQGPDGSSECDERNGDDDNAATCTWTPQQNRDEAFLFKLEELCAPPCWSFTVH